MGTPAALDRLISVYPQIDDAVRADVLDAVAGFSGAGARRNDRVATFLAACAAEAAPELRAHAILALRQAGGEVGADELRFAFEQGRYSAKRDALAALVAEGHADVDLCRLALHDEYNWVRDEAAAGLIAIGSEEALDVLFAGLGCDGPMERAAREFDAHPDVLTPERLLRQSATGNPLPFVVERLGRVPGDEAFEVLVELLDHSSEEIREAAVSALGKSQHPKAADVLARFISAPESESGFGSLRKEIADALVEHRDERVIGLLVDRLYALDKYNRDQVIQRLEQIGTPAVLNALLEHPKAKKFKKASSVFAFARRLSLRLRREGSLDGPVYPKDG